MRLLAIETATTACSVALFEDEALIAHTHEIVGRGHAERLVPMIAALPDRGRADEILVDCGPGSFTGVRVGLAAARALGLAWRAPVHGYSSMALIAAATFASEAPPETIAVVLIGGHGELFVQRFAAGEAAALSPLLSLTPEAAAAFCPDDRLVGSGAETLAAARGSGQSHAMVPDARATVLIPHAGRALAPTPIYGRAPDARLPVQ